MKYVQDFYGENCEIFIHRPKEDINNQRYTVLMDQNI